MYTHWYITNSTVFSNKGIQIDKCTGTYTEILHGGDQIFSLPSKILQYQKPLTIIRLIEIIKI